MIRIPHTPLTTTVAQVISRALVIRSGSPPRRVINRGFAILLLFLFALAVPAIPALVSQPQLPPVARLATAIFPLIMAVCYVLNRRGSVVGALIISAAFIALNTTTYLPETFIDVEGHPITHLGFALPVVVATIFARPLWGLIAIAIQTVALSVIGLAAYAAAAVQPFALYHALSLVVLWMVLSIPVWIFQNAVQQAADLNESLEQRVEERTQQLSELNETLEQRVEERTRQLSDAERRRRDTMRVVGHDMNNRLTQILADATMVQWAITDNNTEQALSDLDRFLAGGSTLARMSADLMDSAMAESGEIPLRPNLTDLHALTQKVIAQISSTARRKQQTLTISGGGSPVWLDPARMQRAIHNIIGNAIKFTPEGGRITLEVICTTTEVVWRCTDTGIGIAPEQVGQIGRSVQRFTDQIAGTGIGMYATRTMIEASGGTLEYSSRGEGHGTTVTMTFPRYTEETHEHAHSLHA